MNSPYFFFIVLPTLGLLTAIVLALWLGRRVYASRVTRVSLSATLISLLALLTFGCVLLFAISTTGPVALITESASQLIERIRYGYPLEEWSNLLFYASCMILPLTYAAGLFFSWRLIRSR